MLDSLKKLRDALRSEDEDGIAFGLVALEKEIASRGLRRYVALRLYDANQGLRERVLQEADDVLNDALLKIFKNIENFSGGTEGEAVAWTNKIVKNLLVDYVRKARRRERLAKLHFFRKAKKTAEERQNDDFAIRFVDATLDALASSESDESQGDSN